MTVAAGEVRDGDGELWVTAARASHYLGRDVTPALVRDWYRRQLLHDHDGLDQTRMVGGRRWYPLGLLECVEERTAGRTKPRRTQAP